MEICNQPSWERASFADKSLYCEATKTSNNISIVDSHPIEKSNRFRFKTTVNHISGRVYSTEQELSAIPHAIKIYKGSTHFALTWHFAHFLLTNQKAIDFRQYLNDVWMPEEEYFMHHFTTSQKQKTMVVTLVTWPYQYHIWRCVFGSSKNVLFQTFVQG